MCDAGIEDHARSLDPVGSEDNLRAESETLVDAVRVGGVEPETGSRQPERALEKSVVQDVDRLLDEWYDESPTGTALVLGYREPLSKLLAKAYRLGALAEQHRLEAENRRLKKALDAYDDERVKIRAELGLLAGGTGLSLDAEVIRALATERQRRAQVEQQLTAKDEELRSLCEASAGAPNYSLMAFHIWQAAESQGASEAFKRWVESYLRTRLPPGAPAATSQEAMPPDWDVVRAMERFGGSFVKALAQCCHAADPANLAKIKATWPDYWKEYADMARASQEHEK